MKVYTRIYKSIIIVWLLSVMVFQTSSGAEGPENQVIILTDTTRSIIITEKTSFLEDESRRLTIADIISDKIEHKFQAGNQETLNLGYKKTVYWVKFTLSSQAKSSQKWILTYNFPRAGKTVTLYGLNDAGEISNLTSETNNPVAEALNQRRVVYRLFLRNDGIKTFYSRIENRAYLPLQLNIHAEGVFVQIVKNEYAFFGVIFGIIFILVMYNLALFLSFKDYSYIYYVILMIAFLLWQLIMKGLIFEFLPVLNPLGAFLYISSPLFLGITLLLFSRSFLKLPQYSPGVDKYAIVLVIVLAMEIILGQLYDAEIFMTARNLLSGLWALSIMIIGILVFRKGYRPARFFMLGMFCVMIPGIFPLLASFDIIGVSVFTNFSTSIGFVFMISMFSLGLVSRVNDTRREKEAAQQRVIEVLKSTEKLKDDFLANTSHELRTPLNGIIGLADAMISGAVGKLAGPVLHNLRLIVHSGRRLTNLVTDILDFSKLKNEDLILNKKPVQIRQIVSLVIPFCQPLLKNKAVRIQNTIPEDIPLVMGDEDRLQQIVYNLLGNAIKFTDSGEVVISAEVDGNAVNVTISDTGIGIPADQLNTVFDGFLQVDAATNRKYEGTGIGLSISRQLVELHDGIITVKSEPGKGSQFSFSIPAAEEGSVLEKDHEEEGEILSRLQLVPSEDISAFIPESASGVENDGPMVLIVDDDPINLTVMAQQLTISQYKIVKASGGRDALKIINGEQPPDLVLLDLMMPDMTGFEVTKAIRQRFSIRELPIIIISAKNRVVDFIAAIKAGANDYLSKPVNAQELQTRLTLHDEFRRQNIELNEYQNELESKVKARTLELNRSLEEVKKARLAAEKANNAKTDFLSNVGHELRSPMQGILGFSILGKKNIQELDCENSLQVTIKEKVESFFNLISESGNRLLNLVNDLLDLSKMEAGKIDSQFSKESISNLVKITINECYTLLTEKRININFDASTFPHQVEMDSNQIFQVLHNLLSNAIKFSEPEKSIGITIEEQEQSVLISIIDNGIGVPKGELEKVFDKFVQSSKTNSGSGGTGLGLSICRQIIHVHHGRIWAEQNPDGGSIFRFTIPFTQPLSQEAEKKKIV